MRSAGIGENVPFIRETICAGMKWCGLTLDKVSNSSIVGLEGCISRPESVIQCYVIPSDEEALIARETARLV
jgi:acetate kinase